MWMEKGAFDEQPRPIFVWQKPKTSRECVQISLSSELKGLLRHVWLRFQRLQWKGSPSCSESIPCEYVHYVGAVLREVQGQGRRNNPFKQP